MRKPKTRHDFAEKRDSLRVDVCCELYCQKLGIPHVYKIKCVNLSCSGISFYAEHAFMHGEEANIHLTPDCSLLPETSFKIKIVRIEPRKDGLFKIGASLVFND